MEDHGEKQIKALGEHGKQLVESNELTEKSLPLDKQQEIFQNFVNERIKEMKELHERR